MLNFPADPVICKIKVILSLSAMGLLKPTQ